MPKLTTLWEPHEGQRSVRESDSRFRIVACGRRWGKTELAAHELFEEAFENPGTLCWWVAPDYRLADIGYEKIKSLVPEGFIKENGIKRSKPKHIHLKNDSKIEFRSAGKEDGLIGEGVQSLVIDEASMVSSHAWKKELRPTLSDTMGNMLAISTPKGQNWFHDYYHRGQSEEKKHQDVESWQAPTYENPHVPDSEVDAARDELPERIFEQEYLARFVDDSGGVFENLHENIVEEYDWKTTRGEGPYYIGVDFARHEDWTVIIVLDAEGRLVHYWRQQHCGWTTIQTRIEDAYAEYEGRVFVDGSRDNKIVTDLESAGVPVTPIKFTSQRKTQMVENLVLAVEKGELTIPDIPQIISEMQMFEYSVTRAGNVRYHAPEEDGFHDDCVDGLALANWARSGAGRKKVRRSSKSSHLSSGSWLN